MVEDEAAVSGITTNNTWTTYVTISNSQKVVLAYSFKTKNRDQRFRRLLSSYWMLVGEEQWISIMITYWKRV
ncbi:MAG TPA: hypothetical protein VFS97_01745 [Nitrososphaeraceae archaeon]|nr:hypothetical protein [Nitrososphaeraceae archaeon]